VSVNGPNGEPCLPAPGQPLVNIKGPTEVVMEQLIVADRPPLETCKVNWDVPGVPTGMPVIALPFRVRPCGRLPFTTDQMNRPSPPVADKEKEYSVPMGADVAGHPEVMVGVDGPGRVELLPTVMAQLMTKGVEPAVSWTVTENGKLPADGGVPIKAVVKLPSTAVPYETRSDNQAGPVRVNW
jgi:hypothetical protein